MFRTRDYILVFTTVVFLLSAIGVTIWKQQSTEPVVIESLILAEVEEQNYTAEVYLPESLSREERLAEMRQKIAESGELSFSSPEADLEADSEVLEETLVLEVEENSTEVKLCPGYIIYSGLWPASVVKVEVVEGARVVYQEVALDSSLAATTTTSSVVLAPQTEKDILLQLPIRTSPMPSAACLASDVIGVAQDGSLIRNNEARLYGVFGSDTLIGYALDGFPIYGVAEVPSDACGGQVINGQYGYYLSAERETVLNCFSSIPTSL